jgi:acyl-CoA synthetase (AMP-forming)/AMP-acid ligase II
VIEAVAGADVRVEDLRLHTKDSLAAYKCPRSIEVVDKLPLSASGKVLKGELRTRVAGHDGST